jgi:hypothetical protein
MDVGRPLHNEIARQPISEFRAQASDFRLPEPPFRQELAFSTPSIRGNANGKIICSMLCTLSYMTSRRSCRGCCCCCHSKREEE